MEKKTNETEPEKSKYGNLIEWLTLFVTFITFISTSWIQFTQIQISKNQNKFEQQMNISGNNKKDDLKSLMKIVSDVEVLDSSLDSLNANDNEKLVEGKKEATTLKNSFYFYLDQDNKEWEELDKVLTDKLKNIYLKTSSEINIKNTLPKTGGDDSRLEETWTSYMKQEKVIIGDNKILN